VQRAIGLRGLRRRVFCQRLPPVFDGIGVYVREAQRLQASQRAGHGGGGLSFAPPAFPCLPAGLSHVKVIAQMVLAPLGLARLNVVLPCLAEGQGFLRFSQASGYALSPLRKRQVGGSTPSNGTNFLD
jgi:hypothetical protein